jgi:hypothetical protein
VLKVRPSEGLKQRCSSILSSSGLFWGCSSAGRAPALQAGGQRFDPAHLHHSSFFTKGRVKHIENYIISEKQKQRSKAKRSEKQTFLLKKKGKKKTILL